ncbi:MAG: TonB-dependent receptor [Acidobacteria bacterium]|nr:TonB-dependent receptor [Acidobacteriota bacterium]
MLNETLRNQARPLVIEDAIEEVRVMTSNISAEYGRFAGGVANAITRSGGNVFSGSFRTTFNNDSWRALTPYEQEHSLAPADTVVPTYEATGGGPVLRDKLWFFTAVRFETQKAAQTTRYTNLAYEEEERDRRFEGKATWLVAKGQTIRAAYSGRNLRQPSVASAVIMDLASLSERREADRLVSLNYSGVLSSGFFVEGQYSRRQYRIRGVGSRFTDVVRGTLILDRSRDSARWNSPTFCAVCGPDGSETIEARDNFDAVVKGSYYWSTRTRGAHHVVFGADVFEDSRQNDNWQSGSGYRLVVNNTLIRDNGTSLYPVIQSGTTPTQAAATYLQWNPIFTSSAGSRLRTYSGFVNDSWTAGPHWSFNLGVRWDHTDAKDQARTPVSDAQAWSPRVSATWDPTATGAWTLHGGFSRYSMGVASAIADLGSGAGRNSSFRYVYMGPSINLDASAAQPVSTSDALTTVFDWFLANGGTNRPLRDAPTYAGVNRVVGSDLSTPSAYDFTVGFGRRLGTRGSMRLDGIFREFRDFYAEQKDLTTGRVTDPRGQLYDLGLIVNTNEMKRGYKALQAQVQYAPRTSITVGGNYTLSRARGNFEGEFEASGPAVSEALLYPEYVRESWAYPTGLLAIDERHNLRLWLSYGMAVAAARADVSVLQQLTSGAPQSPDAPIVVTGFLPNPGYVTPPVIGTYFFGGRGVDTTDAAASTDLSLNVSAPILRDRLRVFARFVLGNIFNQAVVTRPDDTVLTAVLDPALALFNPFTQSPVEGVHYRLGPTYGQALSADGWQRPRWFAFSAGFRF